MKRKFILVAGIFATLGVAAQQTTIPSDYWKQYQENYELYDSWWDVDDQTTSVKVLSGLTPSNGIEVDPSSVYPRGVYTITNENDVFHAKYVKTGSYEKFGITWQTWEYPECENDNWQLVNPINGEQWGEGANCHRTAKGYSVDFTNPENRIVSFKYQAISDNSVNLRVDLCDIKGRKSTSYALCTDGLEKNPGVYDSDPESKSWQEFSIIYASPEDNEDWEDATLEDMWYNGVFYNSSVPEKLADAHNTWWNGIDLGSTPGFDVLLDSSKIVGLEFYINCDVTSKGQEVDFYIKDIVVGNNLTTEEPVTEYKTAVETVYSAKNVEIVDGIVYSEGKIYVVDVLGQQVKSGKNQLDITDLPTGVYFIQTAEGVSKIVK